MVLHLFGRSACDSPEEPAADELERSVRLTDVNQQGRLACLVVYCKPCLPAFSRRSTNQQVRVEWVSTRRADAAFLPALLHSEGALLQFKYI